MDDLGGKVTGVDETRHMLSMSYKELQTLASTRKLPANLRKDQIVSLIGLHDAGRVDLLKSRLDELRQDRRAKRRLAMEAGPIDRVGVRTAAATTAEADSASTSGDLLGLLGDQDEDTEDDDDEDDDCEREPHGKRRRLTGQADERDELQQQQPASKRRCSRPDAARSSRYASQSPYRFSPMASGARHSGGFPDNRKALPCTHDDHFRGGPGGPNYSQQQASWQGQHSAESEAAAGGSQCSSAGGSGWAQSVPQPRQLLSTAVPSPQFRSPVNYSDRQRPPRSLGGTMGHFRGGMDSVPQPCDSQSLLRTMESVVAQPPTTPQFRNPVHQPLPSLSTVLSVPQPAATPQFRGGMDSVRQPCDSQSLCTAQHQFRSPVCQPQRLLSTVQSVPHQPPATPQFRGGMDSVRQPCDSQSLCTAQHQFRSPVCQPQRLLSTVQSVPHQPPATPQFRGGMDSILQPQSVPQFLSTMESTPQFRSGMDSVRQPLPQLLRIMDTSRPPPPTTPRPMDSFYLPASVSQLLSTIDSSIPKFRSTIESIPLPASSVSHSISLSQLSGGLSVPGLLLGTSGTFARRNGVEQNKELLQSLNAFTSTGGTLMDSQRSHASSPPIINLFRSQGHEVLPILPFWKQASTSSVNCYKFPLCPLEASVYLRYMHESTSRNIRSMYGFNDPLPMPFQSSSSMCNNSGYRPSGLLPQHPADTAASTVAGMYFSEAHQEYGWNSDPCAHAQRPELLPPPLPSPIQEPARQPEQRSEQPRQLPSSSGIALQLPSCSGQPRQLPSSSGQPRQLPSSSGMARQLPSSSKHVHVTKPRQRRDSKRTAAALRKSTGAQAKKKPASRRSLPPPPAAITNAGQAPHKPLPFPEFRGQNNELSIPLIVDYLTSAESRRLVSSDGGGLSSSGSLPPPLPLPTSCETNGVDLSSSDPCIGKVSDRSSAGGTLMPLTSSPPSANERDWFIRETNSFPEPNVSDPLISISFSGNNGPSSATSHPPAEVAMPPPPCLTELSNMCPAALRPERDQALELAPTLTPLEPVATCPLQDSPPLLRAELALEDPDPDQDPALASEEVIRRLPSPTYSTGVMLMYEVDDVEEAMAKDLLEEQQAQAERDGAVNPVGAKLMAALSGDQDGDDAYDDQRPSQADTVPVSPSSEDAAASRRNPSSEDTVLCSSTDVMMPCSEDEKLPPPTALQDADSPCNDDYRDDSSARSDDDDRLSMEDTILYLESLNRSSPGRLNLSARGVSGDDLCSSHRVVETKPAARLAEKQPRQRCYPSPSQQASHFLPPLRSASALHQQAKNLRPCVNSGEGCDVVLPPAQLSSHELLCPLSTVCCPAPGPVCGWRGAAKKLFIHLKDVHRSSIEIVSGFDSACAVSMQDVYERKHVFFLKEICRKLFVVGVHSNGLGIYATIQYIASSRTERPVCATGTLETVLGSSSGAAQHAVWKGKVTPIQQDHAQLLASGNCLEIKMDSWDGKEVTNITLHVNIRVSNGALSKAEQSLP